MDYWRKVRDQAWQEACEYLFESGPRMITNVLLALIYLTLLWVFLGKDATGDEVVLVIAGALAPFILIPAIYCWKLISIPPKLNATAQSKISELEAKLKPQIKIFLEGDGTQAFPLIDAATNQPTGELSKYVQFTVAPLSAAPLLGCEARLTSVRRILNGVEGDELAEEHVWFWWSNHESAVVNIHGSIQHRANMFHVREKEEHTLAVDTKPLKVLLPTEIQTPGEYRIRVSVTAHNAPTSNAVFLFHWGGCFDDVAIAQEA